MAIHQDDQDPEPSGNDDARRARQLILDAARAARRDAVRLREELTAHLRALESTLLASEAAREAAEQWRQKAETQRGMAELDREGGELRRIEHERHRNDAEELRAVAEMLRVAAFEASSAARELRLETDRSKRIGKEHRELLQKMQKERRAEEPWKGE
jgi:hypothetical protein